MTKNRKLTAKDKAFMKERDKYRKSINKLNNLLKLKEEEIYEKNPRINELEDELMSKEEWVERLLELTRIEPNQIENYLHEIHYHHKMEKEMKERIDFISRFF